MFAIVVPLVFLSMLVIYDYIRKRPKSPLPPGPPADPLIGHLRVMPTKNQEDVFHEWGKLYGLL